MSYSQSHKTRDPFGHLRYRNKKVDPNTTPNGYGPNSSAGYYNEKSALKVKAVLDGLDPETQIVTKVIKPRPNETITTCYLKFYQGWRYLIEKMDTPEKKYAELRSMIKILKRPYKISLVWRPKGDVEEDSSFDTETVEINTGIDTAESEAPQSWKEVIMLWAINTPDGAPPLEASQRLTVDDREWLSAYLAGFDNIIIIRSDFTGYKIVKNSKLAEKIRQERGL